MGWQGYIQSPPKELVLDFDGTNNPLYCQNEQRFFHGCYDRYCCLLNRPGDGMVRPPTARPLK